MASEPREQPSLVPILTIGYGARSLDQFVDVLKARGVAYLLDVRSTPYSRFKPEFSREALEQVLREQGISYVYMGDQLGGQPEDQSCYVDGKVVYERVKRLPAYANGIARVESAYRQRLRVALMCSEGRPELCHRSKLIGQSLVERNISVLHIDENDHLLEQVEVIQRLTGGQLSLLPEDNFTSRRRHKLDEVDDDA